MRKLLLLMLFALNFVPNFAFDTNEIFGFKFEENSNDYQQYVGKNFFVRPAYGTLETWKRSGFEYKPEFEGKVFTIKKITVKDVEVNKEANKEINVEAVAVNSKEKLKFKAYQSKTTKETIWATKKWPFIGNMPVVFTEPFEEYKKQHMGEIVENSMVKDKYEIIDVSIGQDFRQRLGIKYEHAVPNVTVRNMRTGETVTCPYYLREVNPFMKALEGKYKLSLVRVEKPEDAADRYGETKTIQDEGVDKYSYKDNIIDITIFGTSTEFSFVLKNISDHSIKVVWNEAAFVDLDGTSSKIMHVGTKYIDREKDQPATTIIKGAKIDDVATPTKNVYYSNNTLGWSKHSMLPDSYKGKEAGEVRLMLPIQVKDVVNEYTFVFKVYYSYDHPELLNADKI